MVASSICRVVVELICFHQALGMLQTTRSGMVNMASRGTGQFENVTLPSKLRKLGSTVRQMAKESHHPRQFKVVLDRSKGEPNGIATAWLKGEGGVHCITNINDHGLVSSWNKEHPSQAIKKDDCIVAVNGVKADADAVLNELKQKKRLHMTIQRGGMLMRPDQDEFAIKPLGADVNKGKSEHRPPKKQMTLDKVVVPPGREVQPTTAAKKLSGNGSISHGNGSMSTQKNTHMPAKKLNNANSISNTSAQVAKTNITQVVDAALRAAHRADTIAKEMSTTWTTFPPKYGLANAGCFNHTGRKCDESHSCGPWARCSNKWCVCAGSWGCADSLGHCRAATNKWLTMELRIAPGEDPHKFVAMATDESSGPYLVSGWPDNANAEAMWDFLVQPDNVSVLIATKWGRDHWHGRFLDLNETSGSFEPVQRQPYDALQASWNLIVLPRSRLAFRHTRTGLYLRLEKGKLATCASPDCPAQSADFDVWPRIENDQEPCDGCETPYYQPTTYVTGRTPWFLNPMEGWGAKWSRKNSSEGPWYMEKH